MAEAGGHRFSAAPAVMYYRRGGYVFSALLMLAERDGFRYDRTIGIVGVGNVGSRLNPGLALGIRVAVRSPYAGTGDFLVRWMRRGAGSGCLTFHTPLYKDGPYKTLHLADETLIRRLKPAPFSLTPARGPVVDNAALLARLNNRAAAERGA